LLAIITIAALSFTLLSPFSPRVKFEYAGSSRYTAFDKSIVDLSLITVKNEGFLPIWCSGYDSTNPAYDGRIDNFTWSAFPSEENNLGSGQYSSSARPIRLGSGRKCFLEIPSLPTHTELQVQVQFCDWRGRAIYRLSEKIPLAVKH